MPTPTQQGLRFVKAAGAAAYNYALTVHALAAIALFVVTTQYVLLLYAVLLAVGALAQVLLRMFMRRFVQHYRAGGKIDVRELDDHND